MTDSLYLVLFGVVASDSSRTERKETRGKAWDLLGKVKREREKAGKSASGESGE